MNRVFLPLAVLALALSLLGAAAVLAMDKPRLSVGTEFVLSTKSGDEPARFGTHRVIAADKNGYTTQLLGVDCAYTRPHGGFLLPTVQGAGCTQKNVRDRHWTLTKGRVWPLRTGAKFTYAYRSYNKKGKKYTGKFRCSVGEPTKVSVPAGTFDTFPVACRASKLTRTYYLSPALGIPVKYQARQVTSELVTFTPGSQ